MRTEDFTPSANPPTSTTCLLPIFPDVLFEYRHQAAEQKKKKKKKKKKIKQKKKTQKTNKQNKKKRKNK
eukprot:NODE_27533_length_510_cov_1.819843.p2 GENE.NODE_27533_length_510_cov_1.819843~~NODE_27533_length_510_cov_1.819843.p2  ORF type:complete len:69 (-),score=36.11 NODE_27533_length_510_cov_1.819843:80-286(-)